MSWYATKKASKLPTLDKSKILVFDTETTGFTPPKDEIIQITILDGYGSILFNSYIKPKHRKSWKKAEQVNHINYQMVKDKPTFSEVKSEIQELFNRAQLVVGYNVNFDINFIEAEGIVVSGKIFDVMTAFASYRAAVDGALYRRCKLKECAEYFGHFYNPHSSSEDASATLECFNSLIGDPRFTAYKSDERKKLKEELNENRPKRRASFTLQPAALRRRNITIRGLILAAVAEILLCLTGHGFIDDAADYCRRIINIPAWSADWFESILYILFGIGILLVVYGIVRWIIRLPQVIVAKIKRFINRFR